MEAKYYADGEDAFAMRRNLGHIREKIKEEEEEEKRQASAGASASAAIAASPSSHPQAEKDT